MEMHDIDGFGHFDLSEDQIQVLSAFGQSAEMHGNEKEVSERAKRPQTNPTKLDVYHISNWIQVNWNFLKKGSWKTEKGAAYKQ